MDAWPKSDGEAIHTSTFLGNPLGCAMAVASIRETQKLHLPARADEIGAWWLNHLKENVGSHPNVGEIRGCGLMIGIELVKSRQTLEPHPRLAGRIITAALKKGLILLSGGNYRNILTLTPPLTISRRDLRQATQILKSRAHANGGIIERTSGAP